MNNKEFLEMIQRILIREERWIKWKIAGCQPFEKLSNSKSVENGSSSLKRKFDEITGSDKESMGVLRDDMDGSTLQSIYSRSLEEIEKKTNGYVFNTSREFVTDLAKGLAASFPDFESQIQEYLTADDPNEGIEEEYHPKNDQ